MNMFGKKRGLSDVVTVTLIILLAISAVVIVWVFVRSTLLKVGGQIEGGQCVSIDLKPIGICTVTTGTGGTVTVMNGPGGTTVDKIKLIYYATTSPTSESKIRDADPNCVNIAPLAQISCRPVDPDGPGTENALPTFAGNNPARVGVAAIVGTITCTASTETVTCI